MSACYRGDMKAIATISRCSTPITVSSRASRTRILRGRFRSAALTSNSSPMRPTDLQLALHALRRVRALKAQSPGRRVLWDDVIAALKDYQIEKSTS